MNPNASPIVANRRVDYRGDQSGMPESGLAAARVVAVVDDCFILAVDGGAKFTARRAAGCLLCPEAGDRVLFWPDTAGSAYILSVLEKAGPQSRLAFAGDVSLESKAGEVVLSGERAQILGRERVDLWAPEVTLSGETGQARFRVFDVVSKRLFARAAQAALAVGTAEGVFGRLVRRAGSLLSITDETETIRAKRQRTLVDERWTLDTGSAAVVASEEVTVDGDSIHLG